MGKVFKLSVLLMFLASPMAQAADVGIGVNINVGNRPPVAPVYASPPVVIEEPPVFVMPPVLGFYVAVGIPYDMLFVSNFYYLHRGNAWYRAPHYNGPWVVTPYRSLPPGIRKHRFERIRYYRDEEYRRYRNDEMHYGGHHFRPEKERKEHRKEERREVKEERKQGKEQRKEDKKWEKEQRKEDKKWEKEQRKDEKHEGKGGR